MPEEKLSKQIPGTPTSNAFSWDESDVSKSPKSNSLKSPALTGAGGLTRTPHRLSQSSINASPSPLLLATESITPLTSREEDSAIFSDSDAASQSDARATSRGRTNEKRSTPKSARSSRRRRSDASEKSSRSIRSSSAHKDRVSPTTRIFRNLLILEDSLRQQSKDQRDLRRKFTSFIAILAGLEGFTVYSLYFVMVPPSPFVKIILQFLFFFILVTLTLFHLSGEYRRTIIIPRRFFTSTNKGIRQLNLRLVKVKAPISDQFTDFWRGILRLIVNISLSTLNCTGPIVNTSFGLWVNRRLKDLEIRAQARVGATDVKLVLNARAFSSEIREAWELYRDEFWAREGAKRRHLSVNQDSNKEQQHQNVFDKQTLVERHRKERKDRRKSKVIDDSTTYVPGESKSRRNSPSVPTVG